MDDEKVIDPRYIEMLRKYAANGHKDNDDAMAHAMAGMASVKPEIPHVDIPHRQDIFQPTKSVLDAIDEDIDRQLTAFGNVNGFPVIFVMFEKSMERKDGKTA